MLQPATDTGTDMNPTIEIVDAQTGETVTREMTDEEYAALLATGWTPDPEPDDQP